MFVGAGPGESAKLVPAGPHPALACWEPCSLSGCGQGFSQPEIRLSTLWERQPFKNTPLISGLPCLQEEDNISEDGSCGPSLWPLLFMYPIQGLPHISRIPDFPLPFLVSESSKAGSYFFPLLTRSFHFLKETSRLNSDITSSVKASQPTSSARGLL